LLDCALDPTHGAGEFNENAVPHQLYDPSIMFGDKRLKNFCPASPKAGQCAGLIHFHKVAIADHVGEKDGDQTAVHCGFFA
jgi:hypothetical protein